MVMVLKNYFRFSLLISSCSPDSSIISIYTVIRIMDANGIRSYIAAAKSYLSERQVTAHLNWSIPCQKYTLQE